MKTIDVYICGRVLQSTRPSLSLLGKKNKYMHGVHIVTMGPTPLATSEYTHTHTHTQNGSFDFGTAAWVEYSENEKKSWDILFDVYRVYAVRTILWVNGTEAEKVSEQFLLRLNYYLLFLLRWEKEKNERKKRDVAK